jgi:hypothetical protein
MWRLSFFLPCLFLPPSPLFATAKFLLDDKRHDDNHRRREKGDRVSLSHRSSLTMRSVSAPTYSSNKTINNDGDPRKKEREIEKKIEKKMLTIVANLVATT